MSGTDLDALKDRLGISVFPLDAAYFDDEQCRRALMEHFQVASMEALGLGDYTLGVLAAGALMRYLLDTQKNSLSQMTRLVPYSSRKIYGAGQLHPAESGADGDTAGKTETGFPSVGAGQDKDGHGRPDAAHLTSNSRCWKKRPLRPGWMPSKS